MENVMIGQPVLSESSRDALDEYTTLMDFCLGRVDADGNYLQHSMGGCVADQASTSTVPELCKDSNSDECDRTPVVFAAMNITSTDLPYETPMGLAKDGHIIVGPYNSDGELWSCDEHDLCNGVFLDDNSYAYAMTYTFPYVIGCWGPAPYQVYEASCTTRTCSGATSNVTVAISSIALALFATMTQF